MNKIDPGPDYLKAEDLLRGGEWKEYTLTISEVIPPGTVRAADKTLIDKPILAFEGRGKRLILGNLNQRLMKYATGTAVESEWVGKQIRIMACEGDWFGQEGVAALRIRLPKGCAKPFVKVKDMGRPLTGKKVQGNA